MLAVVGDIHGCITTLKKLYYTCKDKYLIHRFIFLGDIIDRGDVCKFPAVIKHFLTVSAFVIDKVSGDTDDIRLFCPCFFQNSFKRLGMKVRQVNDFNIVFYPVTFDFIFGYIQLVILIITEYKKQEDQYYYDRSRYPYHSTSPDNII